MQIMHTIMLQNYNPNPPSCSCFSGKNNNPGICLWPPVPLSPGRQKQNVSTLLDITGSMLFSFYNSSTWLDKVVLFCETIRIHPQGCIKLVHVFSQMA